VDDFLVHHGLHQSQAGLPQLMTHAFLRERVTSIIGIVICTVGFSSCASLRNPCTVRCFSIWHFFFKRLSPFSWQKIP
jgi:hypothetical protein